MASTVKQITLIPPKALPMMGARGTDVLLSVTADVVGVGVMMDPVCEVPLVVADIQVGLA